MKTEMEGRKRKKKNKTYGYIMTRILNMDVL